MPLDARKLVIVTYPAKVLRVRAKPVKTIDQEVRSIVEEDGRTRLTLGFAPPVRGACGNGVENSWNGYFNLGGDAGYLILDTARLVPVVAEFAAPLRHDALAAQDFDAVDLHQVERGLARAHGDHAVQHGADGDAVVDDVVHQRLRRSGRIVVCFHDAKPTVALARFGSFALSIDTGTPNTAAISSTICSRPARSFGGNESGLRSMSAVVVRKRPVRFEPRSRAQGKKIGWRDGVAAFWHILRFNFLT